ncbi:MAG TPA: alpha-amylase family glycosyl hydrolase, partial [Terrimicrobiaceae bacterium]|nr:alpha-amylase family glycosyl hydrolase [Terrimicrobiaceae bacterium]
DPAAGWMKSSWNQDVSKLVQSDKFAWGDAEWRRPGWDYLNVYQLHVSRFSNRFQGEAPLRRVAREIDSQGGYLRDLGVTAILVMPVNEVGSHNSWGYDPAFFYAIENDYGGPDALKELVDTCHRHGLAVLTDVVFNHAGSTDNILWAIARESYFDGDTQWGAMINFDHPQCRHFFAQNLVYLAREYHFDGFRLDHTATIVHSAAWDPWSGFVRQLGSGGGWDFLHAIRKALREEVDERCLLMAEHLPNEWSLTNFGGPMDTQWCDDFHDRMVDAGRRQFGMSRLAEAFKLSQAACDQWYNVTNYAESHDEVGNVRDRIAYVAGWGQGLRMAKVAAAGTLLSRGIPMAFMGAEVGEDKQFEFGSTATLDLDFYLADADRGRLRAWWGVLCDLRRTRNAIKGPAPLEVVFADGQLFALSRGQRGDYFVMLNFGGWSGFYSLGSLNLPDGTYRELWNSTWPAFAISGENEGEHTNGGRDARLRRGDSLQIPDYGAVTLERVD